MPPILEPFRRFRRDSDRLRAKASPLAPVLRWLRSESARHVVTFENVPTFGGCLNPKFKKKPVADDVVVSTHMELVAPELKKKNNKLGGCLNLKLKKKPATVVQKKMPGNLMNESAVAESFEAESVTIQADQSVCQQQDVISSPMLPRDIVERLAHITMHVATRSATRSVSRRTPPVSKQRSVSRRTAPMCKQCSSTKTVTQMLRDWQTQYELAAAGKKRNKLRRMIRRVLKKKEIQIIREAQRRFFSPRRYATRLRRQAQALGVLPKWRYRPVE